MRCEKLEARNSLDMLNLLHLDSSRFGDDLSDTEIYLHFLGEDAARKGNRVFVYAFPNDFNSKIKLRLPRSKPSTWMVRSAY